MCAQEIGSIQQVFEDWKKKVGHIYTSEEQRARGPEYMKPYYNTEVTQDGIMHFVDGIGDLNPLYRDKEYAKKTKYGCLIAPPNFAYSIVYVQYPDEWPVGVSLYYSGSEREWFRPFCEGDQITYRGMYPSDVQLKSSKFAGQKVVSYEKCEYYRQGGEQVGAYMCYETMVEDHKTKEMSKYQDLAKIPEYSNEDIKKIYAAQDREVARGAEPRYWEDVKVGEELPPVVRGPFTSGEGVAWAIGCHGNVHPSDRLQRLLAERDPGQRRSADRALKIYTSERLIGRGVPRNFAAGEQTEAWRNMVLTNWIGDDGFLWKSSTQIRGFNLVGDTTWCKGKVLKKYCDNGKYCVDIDCWCENQRAEVTIPGTATVILPSREHGPVVYPEPHRVI